MSVSQEFFKGTFQKFVYDFQEFMYSNNVLVSAAGFAIGISTKETIQKLVEDTVIPLIHFLLQFSFIKKGYNKILDYITEIHLKSFVEGLGSIFWTLFVWGVVIIMTFIVLEYVLNRKIIGLKSSVRQEEKRNFAASKAEAKKENIIPTEEDIKVIQKKQIVDEVAGEKISQAEDKKMEEVALYPNNIKSTKPLISLGNHYSSYPFVQG